MPERRPRPRSPEEKRLLEELDKLRPRPPVENPIPQREHRNKLFPFLPLAPYVGLAEMFSGPSVHSFVDFAEEEVRKAEEAIRPGPPPGSGPDPPILGTEANRFYQIFRQLDPRLTESISSITHGPDPIREGSSLGLWQSPRGQGYPDVAGLFYPGSREVTLAPIWREAAPGTRLPYNQATHGMDLPTTRNWDRRAAMPSDRELFYSLGHELAHGYGGGMARHPTRRRTEADNQLMRNLDTGAEVENISQLFSDYYESLFGVPTKHRDPSVGSRTFRSRPRLPLGHLSTEIK